MKFFSIVSALCLMLSSCSNSFKHNEIKQLKEELNNNIRKYYKIEENEKLNNLQIVFSNDSLCIANFDFHSNTDDNSTVKRIEYTQLTQEGKQYGVFIDLQKKKGNYITEEAYDSVKSNKKYKTLDYANSLYMHGIESIISGGFQFNQDEKFFTLNSPSEIGLWNIKNNIDEYGEKMTTTCLVYIGQGISKNYGIYQCNIVFSLTIFDDQESLGFSLYEDGKLITKEGVFKLQIKELNGNTSDFILQSDLGYIATWEKKSIAKKIIAILSKEEILSILIRDTDELNKTYLFKLNTSGYNNAINL